MEISLNPADHPHGCLGWSCPTCPFAEKYQSADCNEMKRKSKLRMQKKEVN